jgi:uncharacterized protein YbjT (DUF2867 family)
MARVLITGGTGGLGSELAPRFAAAGYTVRILSRRPRPGKADPAFEWAQADLAAGTGLAEAIAGSDLIVHCATNPPSGKGDAEATRNLCAAAKAAGGTRVFYISIVGIDRIPMPYYRAKLACERVLEESGVPWTVLRAVQFHSLIDMLFQALTKIPRIMLMPPSGARFQSMDTGEVADRMVAYAKEGRTGRLPDLAGPQLQTLGEMASAWLEVRGQRRLRVPLPLFGKIVDGFRRGHNCVPQDPQGKVTWREWLERRYRRRA